MASPCLAARSEIAIRADASKVREASAWLENSGQDLGIPPDQINRLDLCLNEALANIICHSGASQASPVHLTLDVSGSVASLTVADSGIPFDPLSAAPKPRASTLDEAEPGGLGLLMMQNFSDQLNYCYRDGRNKLTFSVRWADTH